MGSICTLPTITPYDSDTPNYANLTWRRLTQTAGMFGVETSTNDIYYSTAVVAGQQAVESLSPTTYANKNAYVFQLSNDAEYIRYFNTTLKNDYLNRNFVIISNYPLTFCLGHLERINGTPVVYEADIETTEYNGKLYYMSRLCSLWYYGAKRYVDNNEFLYLSDSFMSLAQFFNEYGNLIKPCETLRNNAQNKVFTQNCYYEYGHKISTFADIDYYSTGFPFAKGTSSTIRARPMHGYTFAKSGHIKVYKDGVEIPHTFDADSSLVNFVTP